MSGLLLICYLRGNDIALDAHLLTICVHRYSIDMVSHSTVVVFIFILVFI